MTNSIEKIDLDFMLEILACRKHPFTPNDFPPLITLVIESDSIMVTQLEYILGRLEKILSIGRCQVIGAMTSHCIWAVIAVKIPFETRSYGPRNDSVLYSRIPAPI